MMTDRLGTLSLRSGQIIVVVILAATVGFVLVQLKLVVIPLPIVFAEQDPSATLARSATVVLDAGDDTSESTLSVETSNSSSSRSTRSPTFLNHFVIVPSVTVSPSWGIVTSDMVWLSKRERT